MNEQSFSNQAEFEPLPNRAIVYRALLRRQWINEDTRLVQSEAYYLRKNKNEQGISVNIASVCTPEQCAAFLNSFYRQFLIAIRKEQAVNIPLFFLATPSFHHTTNFDLIFLSRSLPPSVHKQNSQFACNSPPHWDNF